VTLAPGARFGVYDITAAIGEGGMGQVFRATDTRLKRQVAIKVISASFVPDADRIARFRREAEVLASLNHPSIAAIYGLEESDGVEGLVMEFVPGDDLAQRLARGPIAVDEALPLARQIADALEAAHDLGVVHRDLKPANIKVRDDGTVKVLDFGLAKMLEPAAASTSVSLPPTITTPGVTRRGVVLGTAAYMSPEQARGKPSDRRSDVWAFGCVLYEMLTGTRAFDGAEITDVLAAVVRDEPDWSRLPAGTPPSIRRLLRRALTKDRRQRLADIADARLELDETTQDPPAPGAAGPARRDRERWWAALVMTLLLALAATGMRVWRAPQSDMRVAQFVLPPPSGGRLDWAQPISPDGRVLAMIAVTEGKPQIWVRPIDAAAARPLPGTEGATRSFWSPDSRRLAFFNSGDLKEVGIDGSGLRTISRGPFRDGAWSRDGTILLGGQRGRPLMRVSERGGEPVAETKLAEPDELSHDYPEFLPDGRHYVYMIRSGSGSRPEDFNSYVGTLGSTERRPLPGIRAAAKYSPTGHLLFLRGQSLMAQAFDAARLELSGDPFLISDQAAGGRTAPFALSENGTLAFISGPAETKLTWFDRAGTLLGQAGTLGVYENPSLSPDGHAVAFDRAFKIWMLDLDRGVVSRITSNTASDRQPVWSPDGRVLVFSSNRGGFEGIYERTIGASDDRLLFRSDAPALPWDWSRDGRYVAFTSGGDIWALPRFGDPKPFQVTSSRFLELAATFSPDGRWIAYQSDQSTGITRSGEGDVFVQSFPSGDVVRQISTGGGFAPRWSVDGKELSYVADDGILMAVAVTSRPASLEYGAPRPLFRPPFNMTPLAQRARYSVGSNGRYLTRLASSEMSITIILNWFEQLKRSASRD
jgi:Tol biopolymer transport system component